MISGRVQGVGYRDWMVAQARALGVDGWVRNLPDGRVESLASGDDAAIQALLRACRRGPQHAAVSHIEEDWAEPPDGPGFRRA